MYGILAVIALAHKAVAWRLQGTRRYQAFVQ
jgi:hypothetical protein